MGQAKATKLQFFANQPKCCFCGGTKPATTQDHCPPRTLFRGRKWPEGYVFPAYDVCNSATRKDEQLMSLLFRFNTKRPSAAEQVEFKNILDGIKNNFPGALQAMEMSTTEKRNAAKRINIPKPPGEFFRDLPIVKFPPDAKRALERFIFKLGCALHYFHLGEPLQLDGRIVYEYLTNAMVLEHGLPQEYLDGAPELARIERSKEKLDDQFAYRFGIFQKEVAHFVCVFWGSSILIIGTYRSCPDKEWISAWNNFGNQMKVGGYLVV